MKRWVLGLVLVSLGGVTLLGSQQTPSAERGMGQMGMTQNCPMKVTGAEVAVADTPTGIAVTFSAKAEDVKELQHRVERMATMHSAMPGGQQMQGRMIAGDVKYEALPNGARLTLTPKDPAKLVDFRAQVRARVEQMKKGNCSMMEEMMGQMMQGMGGLRQDQNAAPPDNHHPPDAR
jgi:hypothetical protein